MKTRVTWAAELGVGFGAEKTEALFAQNTNRIKSHFKTCQAIRYAKPGKRIGGNASLTALLLGSLVTDVSEKLKIDGDTESAKTRPSNEEPTPLPTMQSEPDTTCYSGKSTGDEIALGYHPNSDRRYTSYSAVFDDTFYVTKEPSLGLLAGKSIHFSLKATNDGGTEIYQIYDDEPHPSLVFQDIVGVITGDIAALGSVSFDEKGKSSISINSDVLGSEGEGK